MLEHGALRALYHGSRHAIPRPWPSPRRTADVGVGIQHGRGQVDDLLRDQRTEVLSVIDAVAQHRRTSFPL